MRKRGHSPSISSRRARTPLRPSCSSAGLPSARCRRAQIELGDAEKAARGLFDDGKTTLVWNLPRELVPKNRAKLLLNMLLVAAGAIPRGGTLTADPVDNGFRITASGLNARVTAATAELLGGSPSQPVDAHAIQPLYTGILGRDCGLSVSAVAEGDSVVVTAR